MNFKKTAVYHLDEENPLLPWAVKKIEKLLEDYRKDPIEILEKYKEFEWIGKIDVK